MRLPEPSPEKSIQLLAVAGIPEVRPGDDLVLLILDALSSCGLQCQDGDVLAITHKIVSKAEGRLVNLDTVTPGRRACDLAEQTGKDPRLLELILQESTAISRARPGLVIVKHRLGFTCANAGIDRSNVAQEETGETVVLLPKDPDASAARLREAIRSQTGQEVGVVIADSHGRPFRLGTLGVAIGVAGVPALWDRRGEPDRHGFELQHTDVGRADEIAAAAGLLMGQAAEGIPVVLIRGLQLPAVEGPASELVRPDEQDLYR